MESTDSEGRKIGSANFGIYAFYDYDGEPIYVGQTREKLSGRVGRHLTNQRTDAVAMRVLDPMEVAAVEIWPLWELDSLSRQPTTTKEEKKELSRRLSRHLDAYEYSAYLKAIEDSRFKAILNEKIPPVSVPVPLPQSYKASLITDLHLAERGHADIRIARRAETVSRLAHVVRERGKVTVGLRRVLVVQAVRLAFLSAQRLAVAEGRPTPSADSINVSQLVGSVLSESPDTGEDDDLM
ncbi:GIY-YIG nuclease family protein [Arthrobacter sp. ATA002]|uniref:GIY-YIG nuclease family protein n=1 Tax=Arthrobacter sp. ATA002 TaxID=2991715 RepID=UPI0022A72437|nr:GIY-YIG nuclease family protein [Arthrobacter sp. ATA002]WAP51451.1 GIY-YIG nuclease family protein [Arthrobacter sp. ATA002]